MKEPSENRLVAGSNPAEPTNHFTFNLWLKGPVMGSVSVEQRSQA